MGIMFRVLSYHLELQACPMLRDILIIDLTH